AAEPTGAEFHRAVWRDSGKRVLSAHRRSLLSIGCRSARFWGSQTLLRALARQLPRALDCVVYYFRGLSAPATDPAPPRLEKSIQYSGSRRGNWLFLREKVLARGNGRCRLDDSSGRHLPECIDFDDRIAAHSPRAPDGQRHALGRAASSRMASAPGNAEGRH